LAQNGKILPYKNNWDELEFGESQGYWPITNYVYLFQNTYLSDDFPYDNFINELKNIKLPWNNFKNLFLKIPGVKLNPRGDRIYLPDNLIQDFDNEKINIYTNDQWNKLFQNGGGIWRDTNNGNHYLYKSVYDLEDFKHNKFNSIILDSFLNKCIIKNKKKLYNYKKDSDVKNKGSCSVNSPSEFKVFTGKNCSYRNNNDLKSHGAKSTLQCKNLCKNNTGLNGKKCIAYASKNNEFCTTYSYCKKKPGTQWGGIYKEAKLKVSKKNLSSCKKECSLNDTGLKCKSIDFDKYNNNCINYYNCDQGDVDTNRYKLMNYKCKHDNNFQEFTNISSLDDCKEKCNDTPGCKAIEYKNKNKNKKCIVYKKCEKGDDYPEFKAHCFEGANGTCHDTTSDNVGNFKDYPQNLQGWENFCKSWSKNSGTFNGGEGLCSDRYKFNNHDYYKKTNNKSKPIPIKKDKFKKMLNNCINDGKYIPPVKVDDLNECKNKCSDDKECKAIAYKSNTKECIIYHRCRKGTYEKWGYKFYYKNPKYCPDNFPYAYNKNNSYCCKTAPIENDMFCPNSNYKKCSGKRCFTKYNNTTKNVRCPIEYKYAYHTKNRFCCKTEPGSHKGKPNMSCKNNNYIPCTHKNSEGVKTCTTNCTCIANDKDIDSF
jgi:hypothetical protein